MRVVSNSYTRVEDHTAPSVNERIRARTGGEVGYYAEHPEQIDRRLEELDREWDIERWLQFNSAALTFAGLGLGLFHNKKWFALPIAVQLFFMQHGVQGWCPPLPAFRRMGVRTAREIEAERNALRALRGDFDIEEDNPSAAIRATLEDGSAASDEEGMITPTRRRVRKHTPESINAKIDHHTKRRVAYYARHPERAYQRLKALEEEWDIERVIEVHGPTLTLGAIAAGMLGRPVGLRFAMLVQSMMMIHAIKGFYPPLLLFRKLGLRTFDEIAAERTAILLALGELRIEDDDTEEDEQRRRHRDRAAQNTLDASFAEI